MKTYHIVRHENSLLSIDWENKELSRTPNTSGDKDWMWFVDEPGVVKYTDEESDYTFEQEVETGDLVVLLYWLQGERRVVVVKAQEWYETCKAKAKLQAERDAFLSMKGESNDQCCESKSSSTMHKIKLG